VAIDSASGSAGQALNKTTSLYQNLPGCAELGATDEIAREATGAADAGDLSLQEIQSLVQQVQSLVASAERCQEKSTEGSADDSGDRSRTRQDPGANRKDASATC